MVKNPPANTQDRGSIPGPERSHMPQSPCITTTEPVLQSQGTTTTEAHELQSLCLATRAATATRSPHTARKRSPYSAQLEKSLLSNKINKQNYFLNGILKLNWLIQKRRRTKEERNTTKDNNKMKLKEKQKKKIKDLPNINNYI